MPEAAEEEDLGATKVLDETEVPAVTFAEGENEKLGEGVEEEDVADENELQRLIEAVREGDQARAAAVAYLCLPCRTACRPFAARACPYHPCRPAYQDVIDELLIGDEEHPPMTGFFVDSAFPDSGLTPLHWLTVENHASVAQWFIDEGQVSCPFLLTSAELCGVHVMPFYTVDAFLLTH